MKLAGRWRNVERRGPRTHIRGQLMATIADSSPLTESTLLRALIAVWVLFDAYTAAVFLCLGTPLDLSLGPFVGLPRNLSPNDATPIDATPIDAGPVDASPVLRQSICRSYNGHSN